MSSFQVSRPISGLDLLKLSIVVSKISTFVHLVDLENVLKQTLGLHGEGVAWYLYPAWMSKTVQVAFPIEPEPQKSTHLYRP